MFNKITEVLSVAEMQKRADAVRLQQDRGAKRRAIAVIVPDKKFSSPRKKKKIWKDRWYTDVLKGENYNFSISLSDVASIEIRDMKDKTVDIRLMYYEQGEKHATKKGIVIPYTDKKIWSQFVSAINKIDAERTNSID